MNRFTQILIAFLTGALTITGAVVYADGRAAFMFVIGAAVVLIGQAALLGSAGRLLRTGQVLVAFAESLDARRRPSNRIDQPRPASNRIDAAAAPARQAAPLTLVPDQDTLDLQNALVNLGQSKAKALAIATAAAAAGGDFEAKLRRALKAA